MYKSDVRVVRVNHVIYQLNVGVSKVIQEWSENSKSTLRVPYVLYECRPTVSRRSVLRVTYEWYTSSTDTLLMHILQLVHPRTYILFKSKAGVLYMF